jgi:hypothetical protein
MASQPQLKNQAGKRPLCSVPYSIYSGRGTGGEGIDARFQHGQNGNQATLVIQVRANDLEQALLDLLGSAKFDAATGYLKRTLPAQHPLFTWLFCTAVVGVRPVKLRGVSQTLFTASPWPDFDHCLVSLAFTQPKYPLMDDASLDAAYPPVTVGGTAYRQEWERYCEYAWTGSTLTLSREGGSFKWVEGPNAGAAFQSPLPQHLSNPDFLVLWRQVPYYGLFSPTTRRPESLLAGINTVNSAAFLGNEVGTVAFRNFTISFNEAPYHPINGGVPVVALAQGFNWPSLTCDVALQFNYFRPDPGTVNYRGHNTAPNRTDNKWYLVTVDGTAGGTTIYPTYDHRKLFARSA